MFVVIEQHLVEISWQKGLDELTKLNWQGKFKNIREDISEEKSVLVYNHFVSKTDFVSFLE